MFPLIEEWGQSGLSQKEFYMQRRIKAHVFWYWLRRYREEGELFKEEVPGFVSVEMEQAPVESVLAEVIYADGTRLVFKERVGLAFLQSLLGVCPENSLGQRLRWFGLFFCVEKPRKSPKRAKFRG